MLSAVWMLLTIIFAVLVWLSANLIYTAGFFVMLGITGTLMLNSKWIYGIIGVCCTGLLLVATFYFEPSWYNSIAKVVSFMN
ncbi:MAG: hypothetical protein JW967_08760 [Dehalococcoidales bacterium]|nr:hypothetical protein [Dehalococcoidales bacterium]